jgi:hypothetical protein
MLVRFHLQMIIVLYTENFYYTPVVDKKYYGMASSGKADGHLGGRHLIF